MLEELALKIRELEGKSGESEHLEIRYNCKAEFPV